MADIVFLDDSSGSVTLPNFNITLNFTNHIIEALDIGQYGTRIGFVRFDTNVVKIFDLKDHFDKSALTDIVDDIYYPTGGTHTDKALRYIRQNSFQPGTGARDEIADILIIMTDGKSNRPHLTAHEAPLLLATGTHVISIGISAGVNVTELNMMATDPDSKNVYLVQNFDVLLGYLTQMTSHICDLGEYMGLHCNRHVSGL